MGGLLDGIKDSFTSKNKRNSSANSNRKKRKQKSNLGNCKLNGIGLWSRKKNSRLWREKFKLDTDIWKLSWHSLFPIKVFILKQLIADEEDDLSEVFQHPKSASATAID